MKRVTKNLNIHFSPFLRINIVDVPENIFYIFIKYWALLCRTAYGASVKIGNIIQMGLSLDIDDAPITKQDVVYFLNPSPYTTRAVRHLLVCLFCLKILLNRCRKGIQWWVSNQMATPWKQLSSNAITVDTIKSWETCSSLMFIDFRMIEFDPTNYF